MSCTSLNKIKILKDSYEKIIQSLVNLQQRRPKAGKSLAPPPEKLPVMTIDKLSQDKQQKMARIPAPRPSPLNPILDRFMDPATREESFKQLFAAIDQLRARMAPFMQCFD